MIVILPTGYRCDIGNSCRSLYIIDEIFYLNPYNSISVNSSDNILDCGAHIGLFTLKFVRQCSRIVAVEPATNNFTFLLKNIALNDLKEKVIPIQRIISNKRGVTIPLYLHKSGMYSIYNTDDSANTKAESVETISVDDLSKELGLRFDIIKVDVEGAEIELLKGASKTLMNAREVIMECHSERLLEESQKILASYGFSCTILKTKRSCFRWSLGRLYLHILLNMRLLLDVKRPDFLDRGKRLPHDRGYDSMPIIYASRY